MVLHEKYMRRCFDLARLGAQTVSPNPMVGAVIVHNDKIIGEGYHHTRGEAHAEVKAMASVSDVNKSIIPDSTIYISLEPCSHQGLTPPCTDLILSSGIKQVAISVIDPNPEVSGRGIDKLRRHGVSVTTGVLEKEGNQLLSNFSSAMTRRRPYVIIKFVQSSDRYIGHPDYQVWLSNNYEKVLVHKLRSEVDGIVVGTNTVIVDNPKLSNREYFGQNPLRILFDRNLRIPEDFYVLDGSIPTLVYTKGVVEGKNQPGPDDSEQQELQGLVHLNKPIQGQEDFRHVKHSKARIQKNVEYVTMPFDENTLHDCLDDLGKRNIQSVLIEGGAALINSFVKQDLWDEAWVVTTHHVLGKGVKAPLVHGHLVQKYCLDSDEIQIINSN